MAIKVQTYLVRCTVASDRTKHLFSKSVHFEEMWWWKTKISVCFPKNLNPRNVSLQIRFLDCELNHFGCFFKDNLVTATDYRGVSKTRPPFHGVVLLSVSGHFVPATLWPGHFVPSKFGHFVHSYQTLCTFLHDISYILTRQFVPSYKHFVPSYTKCRTFLQHFVSSYTTLRTFLQVAVWHPIGITSPCGLTGCVLH